MPNIRQKLTSVVTRCYPFYSGCGSLANSQLVKFFSGSRSGYTWSKVPGGEVLADLNDYVGRAAYYFGDLDRKITWICKQLVREGDTVLDIGANIGLVTVLLSSLVGSKGKVISFEPNPDLVDLLKRTIDHNKLLNVTIHPLGLGSRKDKLKLIIPAGNRGAASLVRNEGNKNSQSIDVDVDTLDNIICTNEITNVRLVKIDVEGFEADVFSGAHDFLTKVRPDAILFELNDRTERQITDEPLIKLLQSYDYDFFVIPKNLFRMKLLTLRSCSKDVRLGHDFLAAPKGPMFDEISKLVRVGA